MHEDERAVAEPKAKKPLPAEAAAGSPAQAPEVAAFLSAVGREVRKNRAKRGMTRRQLYEGYKSLLECLYSYRNYRRRIMQLILNKGTQIQTRLGAGQQDLKIFLRVVWSRLRRASPRQAWLAL